MADALFPMVTLILMLLATAMSLLPVIPGPALVWAIGMLYAVLTRFEQVSPLAATLMTLLMILGSTAGWWLQAAGMKAQGGSRAAILGGLIGGLAGTILIPVPLLGTLAGVVGGTLVIELLRLGEASKAFHSSRIALKAYLLTLLTETGACVLIVIVFAIAVF